MEKRIKPITRRELHFFDNRIKRHRARQKGLHISTILKKIRWKRLEELYRAGYLRLTSVEHFDHNNGKRHKGYSPAGRLNWIGAYSKSSRSEIIGTKPSKWAIQNCR